MKKSIFFVILLSLIPIRSMAAWTITTTVDNLNSEMFYMKILLTSDGDALSTPVDILTTIASGAYGKLEAEDMISGAQARILFVNPGTSTVAPDTTINIELTDGHGNILWEDTGISNTSNSTHQLWETTGDFIDIIDELNIAVNDIGDAGDQVTLYFKCVR